VPDDRRGSQEGLPRVEGPRGDADHALGEAPVVAGWASTRARRSSVWPVLASTFRAACSSPRTGPRLTIATGVPRSAARRGNRYAEKTARDEPATSRRSAASTAANASSTVARGTLSPKKTTRGLSTPPHSPHGATTKRSTTSAGSSASPSGAIGAPRA